MNKVLFMITLLFSLNTWAMGEDLGECLADAQWGSLDGNSYEAGLSVDRSDHDGIRTWSFSTPAPDDNECKFVTVDNNSKNEAYIESGQCAYSFSYVTDSGSYGVLDIRSLPGKNCKCIRSKTLEAKKPCTDEALNPID